MKSQPRDPLHVHAERFLQAVRDDHATQAKSLLDAHPELARYSGHTAAAVADTDALAVFLRADPSSAPRPTDDGTAPLIYAVVADVKTALGVSESARVEAVRLLLDAGADPHRANNSGSTAIMLARWTTGRGGSGSPAAKAAQDKILSILALTC